MWPSRAANTMIFNFLALPSDEMFGHFLFPFFSICGTYPLSWLTQRFSADRLRGGKQFLIQRGQWQISALCEFQISCVVK
jgi:hypothetical protein